VNRNSYSLFVSCCWGKSAHDNSGFTIIEILFAIVILSVAIVPMMNAFSPRLSSTGGGEETAVFSNQARGTLNRLSAIGFQTLETYFNAHGEAVDLATLFGLTGFSDTAAEAARENFSFQGTNYTPAVTIAEDAGGLLEITVTINHISLKTLVAEY